MRIRIVGTQLPGRECGPGGDFPGYSNIYVGVQRRNRCDGLTVHPAQGVTTLTVVLSPRNGDPAIGRAAT